MNKTPLTAQEIIFLQHKIIEEGWMPVEEKFSLHVYESRWDIEGEEYVLFQAIGHEDVEGYILTNS